MIAMVAFAAVGFAWWFIAQWRKIPRRSEPGLMDMPQPHAHQWRTVPGSALDRCRCGVVQVRRWTS